MNTGYTPAFKHFCEEYFTLSKKIHKVDLQTKRIRIMTGDTYRCTLKFNIPYEIKLLYTDDAGDYCEYSSYIIDRNLRSISKLFKFPNKISKKLTSCTISNTITKEGNFKFSYTKDEFTITVTVTKYTNTHSEKSYFNFIFILEENKKCIV